MVVVRRSWGGWVLVRREATAEEDHHGRAAFLRQVQMWAGLSLLQRGGVWGLTAYGTMSESFLAFFAYVTMHKSMKKCQIIG